MSILPSDFTSLPGQNGLKRPCMGLGELLWSMWAAAELALWRQGYNYPSSARSLCSADGFRHLPLSVFKQHLGKPSKKEPPFISRGFKSFVWWWMLCYLVVSVLSPQCWKLSAEQMRTEVTGLQGEERDGKAALRDVVELWGYFSAKFNRDPMVLLIVISDTT